MSPRSILAIVIAASTAFATPLDLENRNASLTRRDGPDNCPATNGDAVYVADVRYYSDSNCMDQIASLCTYAGQGAIDDGSGTYVCEATIDLPTTTPYYAQIVDTAYPSVQIEYTQDQSCPPSGPGAVFATLDTRPGCVEFNVGGTAPGISLYPNGGSSISKKLKKRDPSCSGFTIDSQQSSESNSVQISIIVDCTNAASDAGCSITKGDQMTKSVSTSYSLSAGGGIEGVFDIGATFGMEYTDSETTTMQEGFTIPQGQKGYLSSYSTATLFQGSFTGCDSGDDTQPGEALVLMQNGLTYEVINTSA